MRNRQQFVARLALAVHPLPEFTRIVRIDCGEGHVRHLLRVQEEDVAVQVRAVRRGGPLIGRKRRELAGLVILVRDLHQSLPVGAQHFRGHQLLDGAILEHGEREELVGGQ